jgi:hypothetical protein
VIGLRLSAYNFSSAGSIEGQFDKPVQIVASNTAEGWSRDAIEDIGRMLLELSRRGAGTARSLSILWSVLPNRHRLSSSNRDSFVLVPFRGLFIVEPSDSAAGSSLRSGSYRRFLPAADSRRRNAERHRQSDLVGIVCCRWKVPRFGFFGSVTIGAGLCKVWLFKLSSALLSE